MSYGTAFTSLGTGFATTPAPTQTAKPTPTPAATDTNSETCSNASPGRHDMPVPLFAPAPTLMVTVVLGKLAIRQCPALMDNLAEGRGGNASGYSAALSQLTLTE